MRRRDVTAGLLAAGVAAPLISPTGANASNRGDGPDRIEPVGHIILGSRRHRVRSMVVGTYGEVGVEIDLRRKFTQSKDNRSTIFGRANLPLVQRVQQADPIGPVRFNDGTLFAEIGIDIQFTAVLIGDGKIVFKVGKVKKQKRREFRVPHLDDIPIIGAAFMTSEPQVSERDLIILVTPGVVDGQT